MARLASWPSDSLRPGEKQQRQRLEDAEKILREARAWLPQSMRQREHDVVGAPLSAASLSNNLVHALVNLDVLMGRFVLQKQDDSEQVLDNFWSVAETFVQALEGLGPTAVPPWHLPRRLAGSGGAAQRG